MFRLLDLFSGIGGFSLGLERSGGFKTVAFCEIEPFPRRVLKKHWPDVPIYEDVRTLTAERLAADGISVDAICGGFPCQDLSVAGKRAGIEGERSGLWSEYARLIGEIRPRIVIVENVTGLLSGPSQQPGQWFGRVLGDLAALGYHAEWHCIPASALGAPHIRDRVWIVAHSSSDDDRREPHCGAVRSGTSPRLSQEQGADGQWHWGRFGYGRKASFDPNADQKRLQERKHVAGTSGETGSGEHPWGAAYGISAPAVSTDADEGQFALGAHFGRMGRIIQSIPGLRDWPLEAEPVLDRGTDGVPNRVDRCGALGNAVVPQIPELIGRAIMEAEGMA